MKKELIKEVPFGKGIARITVTMFTEEKYMDGFGLGGKEVLTTSIVEIIANGRVVSKGYFAKTYEYNELTDTFYERGNLDKTKKYTTVGDRAITVGDEAGKLINATIEELKRELAAEFEIETADQKQEKEEIEEAKAIVKLAEKEGLENLMSDAELKVWRKQYNDLHNEGGEGYIPTKVSKESYERALTILNGRA